jgi:hypothetical protein
MFSSSRDPHTHAAHHCPVCNGQFGLIRRSPSRTSAGSKTGRDRVQGHRFGVVVLAWLGLRPRAERVPVPLDIPLRRAGRNGRMVAARWD